MTTNPPITPPTIAPLLLLLLLVFLLKTGDVLALLSGEPLPLTHGGLLALLLLSELTTKNNCITQPTGCHT